MARATAEASVLMRAVLEVWVLVAVESKPAQSRTSNAPATNTESARVESGCLGRHDVEEAFDDASGGVSGGTSGVDDGSNGAVGGDDGDDVA